MSEFTANEKGQGRDERQPIRELDRAFAAWAVSNFCGGNSVDAQNTTENLAMAVSYALHLKHSCLDLGSYGKLNDPILDELLMGIDEQSVKYLDTGSISTENLDMSFVPLVRSKSGNRVWMQKYHLFESAVSQMIGDMAGKTTALTGDQEASLAGLYPDQDSDKQRQAVATALTHKFCVITGGPGTGKTWTVARIIALMLSHGLGEKRNLRIALAAPTGKAANRMYESLSAAATDEKLKQLVGNADLPDKARTLHSLLGIRRGSPKPRHHAANPLAVDVLIVDEASMVDLPMMYRILNALPEHAHLILLGDKDQLASVEAGSVLGELCSNDSSGGFAAISSAIAILTKNYRSEEAQGINEFAQAINKGLLPDVSANRHVELNEFADDSNPWKPGWLDEAAEKLGELQSKIIENKAVAEVLGHQTDFQILCALRNGPAGVAGINSMVEKKLGRKAGAWYSGLPVMITANDHDRQLYNGDIGLVLPVSEQDGTWVVNRESGDLKACFPASEGRESVKLISLAQMPPFETCYAMTVHKSQGSEYNKVLFILPASKADVKNNPVLTRELIYTGVTRAKREAEIWSGGGVLEVAISKRAVRMSGLGRLP